MIYEFAIRRIRDYYISLCNRHFDLCHDEELALPYLTTIDRIVLKHEKCDMRRYRTNL
jgi:hypothetical protein